MDESRPAVREKEGAVAERIDRRALRTRRALSEALLSLIVEKGYDEVSVQDIIDRADIGRSTFYAHYTGKEDLLRSGFATLREELREAKRAHKASPERAAEPLSFSLAMFEHGARYAGQYRAAASGRGGAIMEAEIRRALSELVREELRGLDEGAAAREFVVQFVVSAFLTAFDWWFGRKPQLAPAEIDTMFRRLVLGGIGPLAAGNRPSPA
jgi:AcrR family transcriptional regulator